MSLSFVFIGAGNLATHLSEALKINGYEILQVYSRTEKSAKFLAEKLDAGYTNIPENIISEADIYVVALKDDAYQSVLSRLDFGDKLLVHCSGSLPISVLDKFAVNSGVIYPLQTFSKQREINFREVPVFVEANAPQSEKILTEIAQKISGNVSVLNSEKRKILHISAVFACNFVNHLYTIASGVLKTKEIPFDVLKPLISETAAKVQVMSPEEAQTGPAIRFDENIIFDHLNELKELKNYRELYNSISKSIFEFHQKNR